MYSTVNKTYQKRKNPAYRRPLNTSICADNNNKPKTNVFLLLCFFWLHVVAKLLLDSVHIYPSRHPWDVHRRRVLNETRTVRSPAKEIYKGKLIS